MIQNLKRLFVAWRIDTNSPALLHLTGHVCSLKLIANPIDEEPQQSALARQREEQLYYYLIQRGEHAFNPVIKERVKGVLGEQFEVEAVHYYLGSLEIEVVIAALGVVQLSGAEYRRFIERLEPLVEELKTLLGQRARRVAGQWEISGRWVPGAALIRTFETQLLALEQQKPDRQMNIYLVTYLVIGQTALILLTLAILTILLVRGP